MVWSKFLNYSKISNFSMLFRLPMLFSFAHAHAFSVDLLLITNASLFILFSLVANLGRFSLLVG
jgi:hypothetical protein